MNTLEPWLVMEIELSAGIPTLAAVPKYQGIYVSLWWYGIPLGHLELTAKQLPISAIQLANLILPKITPAVGCHLLEYGFKAPLPVVTPNPERDKAVDFESLMALSQPLQQVQQRYSQSADGDVSVVICTRDRPQQLARCLASLQHLSTPPSHILVIDNAPTDDATRHLVAQYPGVEYIHEPRPGLSVARNTGIRHSRGDIIAFTDDDVIVHPDWITRLQQGFSDPKILAVTGLILPAELETTAQVMFQNGSGGNSWGYRALTFDTQFFTEMQPRGVPVWRIGAGANMAFRRQAFDLVGYFDERLGAGASGCSEDSEFWYRILAAGWLCRYEPTAAVYHYHRSDMDSLNHQLHQYMRGHVAALLVQFANHKHWGNLRRLGVALPRYYLGRLRREWSSSSLWAEISGCISGIKFYTRRQKGKPYI